MRKLLTLCCATALVMGAGSITAQAMSLAVAPGISPPSSEEMKVGYICGPGFHLGPHGHYCWPNGTGPVPPGYGYPCPPHYHLGPKGHECWPNH
jgi:hypothetical protein